MTQELDNPLMLHFIEKAANIGLDNVADRFPLNRLSQFIEAGMLAASRTIAIAAIFKRGLINRF